MGSNNIQMDVSLEFVVEERMRTYEFTISGNSFKETKDRANALYAEILHTEIWHIYTDY